MCENLIHHRILFHENKFHGASFESLLNPNEGFWASTLQASTNALLFDGRFFGGGSDGLSYCVCLLNIVRKELLQN